MPLHSSVGDRARLHLKKEEWLGLGDVYDEGLKKIVEIWKWKVRERNELRRTPRLLASATLLITEVFAKREGY